MDRSDVTLERMRSFVRVVERGSFSATAREAGFGQATITRHVAELERALGVTLLLRTTRRLQLTPEGLRYHEEARAILRMVDEATDSLRQASEDLAGPIRVSCTGALAIRHVAGALFAFQDRHPGVSIDLNVSDVSIDLVREATDLAIRLGPLADSSMQRKPIGPSRRTLVAARTYLDRYGRPQHPDELRAHRKIRMSNVTDSDRLALAEPDGGTVLIPVEAGLLVDHGLAAREAIRQGRGIAPAHLWLVDDLIASGEVERILPDYSLEPAPLSILIAPGRLRIRRIRQLVDDLAGFLKALPGIADES